MKDRERSSLRLLPRLFPGRGELNRVGEADLGRGGGEGMRKRRGEP